MQSYRDLNHNYVSNDLSIIFLKLKSLSGCPDVITGEFDCFNNELSSLVGGPRHVDGHYACDNNQLTDLVGCASHIGGNLYFRENQITSLVGIHKIIKRCNGFTFTSSIIKEGGIGLLLIENLANITSYAAPFKIIEKYLGTGTKGMLACRDELIANGFEEYAKL